LQPFLTSSVMGAICKADIYFIGFQYKVNKTSKKFSYFLSGWLSEQNCSG
jgi:hypothetical protein